jgi:hypothetical protein
MREISIPARAVEVDDRAIQIIGSIRTSFRPPSPANRPKKQKCSRLYTQMARQMWLLDEFDIHVCEIGEIPPSDGQTRPNCRSLSPARSCAIGSRAIRPSM